MHADKEDNEGAGALDTLGAVPEPETNGEVAGSILDQLREKRNKLLEEHHLDVEVPGYEGLVYIRVKPFPFREAEAMAKRLQKDKVDSKNLAGSADTIIAATDMILVRDPGSEYCLPDPETGEPSELRPIGGDAEPPIKFDSRLPELLGYEAKSARAVVFGLFANEFAVVNAAINISRWMQDTTKEVNEDFLGE